MGKFTLILGIILTAMIFEKNPLLCIAIIGFYFAFKFQKKHQEETQKLIKSQKYNTFKIIFALEKGFEKIRKAITAARQKKLELDIYQTRNDDFNK